MPLGLASNEGLGVFAGTLLRIVFKVWIGDCPSDLVR
jgi:hypothetical protein